MINRVPYRNSIRHGGRYMDPTDTGVLRASLPFNTSDVFEVAYNGSVISEAGKFIDDNTDNGGSRGAMTATTLDLLTAMGRGGSRYGPEFFISQWAAGAGVGGSTVEGHHLMGGSTSLGLNFGNRVSYACWLRLTAGTGWVQDTGDMYIDGVEHVGNKELSIGDGWIHVAGTYHIPQGYYTKSLPGIHGESGTVIQKALPVILPANFQIPVHTQPLM